MEKQKRFIVTNPYPNSPYKVGDMVNKVGDHYHITTFKNRNEFGELEGIEVHCHESEIEKYSNLFRELQWWEHREESEMPEYVKIIKDHPDKWNPHLGKFFKYFPEISEYHNVIKWETDYSGAYAIINRGKSFSISVHAELIQPATESEYTKYINSKNQ